MARKRTTSVAGVELGARSAGAALVVAGALAGAGILLLRHGAGRRTAAQEEQSGPREWHCQCGQEFRVSGLGRHRVYWLADAPESEPVLTGSCPSCDRPLPAD